MQTTTHNLPHTIDRVAFDAGVDEHEVRRAIGDLRIRPEHLVTETLTPADARRVVDAIRTSKTTH